VLRLEVEHVARSLTRLPAGVGGDPKLALAPNLGYVDCMRFASMLVVSICLGLAACGDDDSAAPDETAATGEEATAPDETAATEEEATTLDAAQVESALTKALDGVELIGAPVTFFPEEGGAPEEQQLGGGRLEIRSVKCPEGEPVEQGGEFTCQIEGNQDGSVRVTQLDSSGSRASYKAKFDLEQLGVETTVEGKTKLD
jgi:hypothetical protein